MNSGKDVFNYWRTSEMAYQNYNNIRKVKYLEGFKKNASGLYYVKMTAGNFISTQKLMLIK